LKTHEIVARRGNPIILEGINSRMAHAKQILDEAYDAFGAPPAHGITEARIAEEDEKIALAATIFAPSALVETALAETPLESRFLRSSYGVDTSRRRPSRTRPVPKGENDPVVYMFCGYACVRKGIHHLLDIWPQMPRNAYLKLVGQIEPVIAERYANVLASDRVETTGFTSDPALHYAEADIFVLPSLEEGDPLVSYEAAFFGLPSVTSHIGGGRLGEEHPDIRSLVEPADSDAFEAALVALHVDAERRVETGRASAEVARAYDWMRVGAKRLQMLERFLPDIPA
jgi:glycosyltransferase involved in cell wall biosynthesis